ncbi:MAG: D-aminoacyl-tRNA deacylase [Christensenellales bacterium]
MIAVIERVLDARVKADGSITGGIGKGLLVLLGVENGDSGEDVDYIVRKTAALRIFPHNGKMDKSVMDIGGQLLVVSQFTLLGDARRGTRPDFGRAALARSARQMYEECIKKFRALGIVTQSGEFGAHMIVESRGDGPVTILLNSRRGF